MKVPDLSRDRKHEIIGRIIQLEYPAEWKIVTAEDTFVTDRSFVPDFSRPTHQEIRAAEETVDRRRAELELLSISELQQVKRRIRTALSEEVDKELWFSRPDAKADVSFWSKKITWDIDAGTALLFDKDPRYVSWEGIRHHRTSPFAKKYGDARSLILEAVDHKILPDPLVPSDFLKWAQRINFDVSQELLDAVMDAQNAKPTITGAKENKKGIAKSGGQARAAKYEPIKAFAMEQANLRNYPSARQAAIRIKDSVLKFAKDHGVTLSEERALQTLQEWLAEGGFKPSNK